MEKLKPQESKEQQEKAEIILRFFRHDEKENDTYRYQFKFMDDIETIENDTIRNIHFTIGSNIARMLDKKLK